MCGARSLFRSRWGNGAGQDRIGVTRSALWKPASPSSFALVVVVFEFGMVFSSYVAVINASRAGASYASMYPNPASAEYGRYADIARNEARAGRLRMETLDVLAPVTPEGMDAGDPISVTVVYRLQTFSSGISLPIFGRLGLPSTYTIRWTTTAPIR